MKVSEYMNVINVSEHGYVAQACMFECGQVNVEVSSTTFTCLLGMTILCGLFDATPTARTVCGSLSDRSIISMQTISQLQRCDVMLIIFKGIFTKKWQLLSVAYPGI